jgi:hypothetical protein
MKTIPQMIVDGLSKMGLVRLPATSQRIALPSQRRDRVDIGKMGKVNSPSTYDPDKEFVDAANLAPIMFDFTKDTDHLGRKIVGYSAQLYETNGNAYRVRHFEGKDKILEAMTFANTRFTESFGHSIAPSTRLREAADFERDTQIETIANELLDESIIALREGRSFISIVTNLRESALREDSFLYGGNSGGGNFSKGWFNNQYGDNFDADSEYTPIMGGPWNKQLYLSAYLDMHSKAFEAYNHNPLAHQLVKLATMFTLGRGIDHTSSNVEIDELIREFVDRTDFYDRLQNMATDLWWAGELFIEFYDNAPSKGLTDFRTMDPSTVLDIITQPDDFRNVYYLHQQYSTPYQNYIQSGPNQPLAVKYIIRQVPANKYHHVKINSSEYEKRGRSELFSILGWLKRLKDLMNARVIKGQLEAAFVWDIEVATGDADVQSTGLQLPDPYNPGATFIHNKSLKLTPQSSKISGSDAAPDIAELKNLIATGASTPKEFIGETAKGGRSGSLASTEPGTKNYESKQQIEMRIVYAIYDRVIMNAAKAGLIDLDEVLQDARTVTRLAVTEDGVEDRDDVQKEFEQNKEDQQQQQQAQMDAQNAAMAGANAGAAPMVNVNKTQPAKLGAAAPHAALPGGTTPPPQMVNVNKSNVKETLVTAQKDKNKKMTGQQLRRIKAIKASGKIARELIELSFPSIAQEDRSAKLKDLALAEAMEWLPKSVTATLAAKELNITTYDFADAWATIIQEAKDGMSIAHVYGQDNKHVPSVAIAQSVQEEDQAMQPAAGGGFTNVPIPPTVNGMKLVPPQQGGAGGNGPPPGQKPNSGDSKVNGKSQIQQPNPADPSPKNSNAGKSPFTNEGRANGRSKEAFQAQIYGTLLKEAIKPVFEMRTQLSRYILQDEAALKQFEEAVAVLASKAD